MTIPADSDVNYSRMQSELIALVQASRNAAARRVNALMSATYWLIGRRIVEFEQGGAERADYGQALLKRLSFALSSEFGRGFSVRNLEQMRLFYRAWPLAGHIPQTPSANSTNRSDVMDSNQPSLELATLADSFPLPWSAYVRLLSVKSENAREFYETEALRSGWSVRQLDRQIGSQFYERVALSKNKAAMLQKAESSETAESKPEQAIRDPFVLEFLDLKDEYSESDLEEALVQNLSDFLLELGDDFAFIGRQRRLRIDNNWFRIDLVFFHRQLTSLLIIDLKVGSFSYADAGQMHMYLNYAREHWMKSGENPPVGLILCAEKGAAEAHYALEGLPNKVLSAEYQTVLPDESILVDELTRTQRELEHRQRPLS